MKPIAFVAVLAAMALAQHWDSEQVDSAGWGARVDMRWHPDGRLFLCYSDTSGIIRLASKDSVWSYEDLPQWRSVIPGTQGFDIDARGTIGVSYASTDDRCWCALKSDTGWTGIQTPFNAYPYSPSLTTFDTAGAPAICAQHGDTFLLARMQDTAWVTCTLATGYYAWTNWFWSSALGSTAGDLTWGAFQYSFSFPGKMASGSSLHGFQARDSDVSVVQIAGGTGSEVTAASGCVDGQGSVHSCYDYVAGLYLDQSAIDTTRAERTAVKFDSLDRPQIAYVRMDGGLMYRYLDAGVWHILDLQTGGVTALSLIIGENSQPLIAYTTSEGVFLAHGVDVAGQSEEQQRPTAIGRRPTASVVRNVLLLPADVDGRAVKAELLDAGGRKVLGLRPGANDVSCLTPGVYFVRVDSVVGGQQSGRVAVRKVIVL